MLKHSIETPVFSSLNQMKRTWEWLSSSLLASKEASRSPDVTVDDVKKDRMKKDRTRKGYVATLMNHGSHDCDLMTGIIIFPDFSRLTFLSPPLLIAASGSSLNCPFHLFNCGNGRCLDPTLVKDGINQCGNNYDEVPGMLPFNEWKDCSSSRQLSCKCLPHNVPCITKRFLSPLL